MEREQPATWKKQRYVEPRVLTTYEKEELEESIKPHGTNVIWCH